MTITETRTTIEPAQARSAYPASVEALMPRARRLAEAEGGLPSRNKLMEILHVGAPKAKHVLAALRAEGHKPHRGPRPRVPATRAGNVPETTTPDPAAAPVEPTEAAEPSPTPTAPDAAVSPQHKTVADPDTKAEAKPVKPHRPIAVWPVLLLLLPATVAIWSGWVGLGELAGFGPVNPLPGIADDFEINTAITLPIGMETYSAYALYVWLSGRASAKAVAFARVSALLALGIGSAGQVAYHLIAAPDAGAGPVITAIVACIPVAVLGLGAALAHLVKNNHTTDH